MRNKKTQWRTPMRIKQTFHVAVASALLSGVAGGAFAAT
jgi:hypothetical protein